MHSFLRIGGIVFAFVVTAIAWLVLGGITSDRSNRQQHGLQGQVAELWGSPHRQAAPTFTHTWYSERDQVRSVTEDGRERQVRERVRDRHDDLMLPSSSDIEVDLSLDHRRKGLVWYALYDVDFAGEWSYVHEEEQAGWLALGFAFPDAQGLYDEFHFEVDGRDLARTLTPTNGRVVHQLQVEPGQRVDLAVRYRSRGMDQWTYVPANGVANLEDFSLAMHTDFEDIDFPSFTMSPSDKARADDGGWDLDWSFAQVVTGHGVGMVMPQRIQPGELAAALSFSAPVSLGFFFLILFVLSTLRGIEIHPINYLLLGGAFFAFHLLFAYTADHLAVVPAFTLASVVSVVLVVSYLRLVVSERFAFVEAGLAQLVYLVGFSLAHFFDGYTGLSITLLAVVTLFLVMQWTGRVKWSEALAKRSPTTGPLSPATSAG